MNNVIQFPSKPSPAKPGPSALVIQFPRPDQLVPARLTPAIMDIISYCDRHGFRPIYSSGSLEIEAAMWLQSMGVGRLLNDGGSLIFTPDPERINLILIDQELTRRWQQGRIFDAQEA